MLADRVVIDFMGFTLDGASADDYGIDVTGQHHVVIKNGFLKRFSKNAIQDSVISSVSEGIVVQDMTITGFYSPTPADIYGIRLPGLNNRVERCFIRDFPGFGISIGGGIVKENILDSNSLFQGINAVSGTLLINNVQ